jgi:uncharacterized protein (DUF885 family)
MLPMMPLVQASAPAPVQTADAATQDAALLKFLDAAYDEQLALSPESQTQLGLKTQYDRLDDYTDAAAVRAQALSERQLKDMRTRFRPERLGDSARVSFRLFEYEVERSARSMQFRKLRFPVSTNGSPAGEIPVLLINNHKIDTVSDAQAYIARLRETERVMREVTATMRQ